MQVRYNKIGEVNGEPPDAISTHVVVCRDSIGKKARPIGLATMPDLGPRPYVANLLTYTPTIWHCSQVTTRKKSRERAIGFEVRLGVRKVSLRKVAERSRASGAGRRGRTTEASWCRAYTDFLSKASPLAACSTFDNRCDTVSVAALCPAGTTLRL